MDIPIEDVESDSAPLRHGVGKGPMTVLRPTSSNPHPRRSMRDIAPEGERSEEESAAISIEGNDNDTDKVEDVSQGGRATQDNLDASLSEDESDMDDEEYARRDLTFKESQVIKPKFT